jgi:hypothetical protein
MQDWWKFVKPSESLGENERNNVLKYKSHIEIAQEIDDPELSKRTDTPV